METPRLKRKFSCQIVRWAKAIRSLIIITLRIANQRNQIKMCRNFIRSISCHVSSRPKAYKDSSSKPKNRGIWQLISLGIIVSCLPSRLIWYPQPEKSSKLRRDTASNYSRIKPISVRWACLGYLIPIIRTSTCFKILNLMKSLLCIAQMKPTSTTRTQHSPSLGNSSLIFQVFRLLVKSISMRTT